MKPASLETVKKPQQQLFVARAADQSLSTRDQQDRCNEMIQTAGEFEFILTFGRPASSLVPLVEFQTNFFNLIYFYFLPFKLSEIKFV